MGVCSVWRSVVLWGLWFLGVCGARVSVMFRGLWRSGVCAVWGPHFLGSAVLGGLWCSAVCAVWGVCSARGSVLLEALRCWGVHVAQGSGFWLFPTSGIPAPSFSLRPLPRRRFQLPFPSSRRSRPSQRCHLPAGPSPAPILDPSSPCFSRTCCSQPSVSRFPPRAAAPPVLPRPGICPSRPHGKGTGFRPWGRGRWCHGPSEGVTRTQIRGPDAHPRGHPAGMRAGIGTGHGDWWHQRGLLPPCCDRRSYRASPSSLGFHVRAGGCVDRGYLTPVGIKSR